MAFGSIFAKLSKFRLDAADGQYVDVNNNMATKIALRLFGVPHMGLRIRANLVSRFIRKIHPVKIIDAGSGNGLYTLELAAQGYDVLGIEIDPSKASRVESYLKELGLSNAFVKCVDLTQNSELTHEADFIICSDVLEHIPDDNKAVKTIKGLLNPDGVLLITVPRVSPFSLKVENSYDHVRPGYTEESMKQLLESNGFIVQHHMQFFKTFGRLAWKLDRSMRNYSALRALAFWPFFLIAQIDKILPAQNDAGGLLVLAKPVKSNDIQKLTDSHVN